MRYVVPRLGHALIDRQHARLLADTRALRVAVGRGTPARALMTRLLRDLRRHFASESRLMRSVGYPDEVGHLALHDGLLIEMRNLREVLAEGRSLHPRQVERIFEWLIDHSGEADRRLVDCLHQR